MKGEPRSPTTKPHRLAARWDKRTRDLIVDCSPRFGNASLRYLCDVLNKGVLKELESRGFDLSTLRFHIDKTPEAVAEHERTAGRAVPPPPPEQPLKGRP